MRRWRALVMVIVLTTASRLSSVEPGSGPGDGSIEARPDAMWAIGRFAAAGLDLPPVAFEFDRTGRSACGGNTAVTVHGGAIPRIVLCADPEAPEVVAHRALLHELAHVWAAYALGPEERRAFVELRGARSWNDADTAWCERGSEQAAEIITWGLMDRELAMVTIADDDRADLVAGYRSLTGSAPPPR